MEVNVLCADETATALRAVWPSHNLSPRAQLTLQTTRSKNVILVGESLMRLRLLHVTKVTDSVRKNVELAADIAIVIVAVMLCAVLMKNSVRQ